jgi:hypothetical protein
MSSSTIVRKHAYFRAVETNRQSIGGTSTVIGLARLLDKPRESECWHETLDVFDAP